MSQKTHKSAVVIIPPTEVWPPIQAIREKHDSHYPRWMPHITVLYPFYPKSAFLDYLPRLEMACLRVKPFEITFGRFHYFSHRGKRFTLWLKP
ncbi:2'-5' RNA ligase family protein, partial [bacterium]|nr:2'-5' RNA ligase family protein [bacterium]